MNFHQVQERAALMARAQGITQSEALAQMSRAAAAARKRRRDYGRTEITPADKAEFRNVDAPRRRFWWQEDN